MISNNSCRTPWYLLFFTIALFVLGVPNQSAAQQWQQKGSDIDGESSDDNSGHDVSLNAAGSMVAIGATGNDGTGLSAGHVRVYNYNGSNWVQQGADIDGEAQYDGSGFAVDMNWAGDVVAIGAPWNDAGGITSGHARIWEWNGSAWVQKGGDLDGGAAGDYFGYHLDMDSVGNTIAVGALEYAGTWQDQGRVYIYDWDGNAWNLKGQPIDGLGANYYMGSVAISADGNICVIGARGANSYTGMLYVFEWNGTVWVQKGAGMSSGIVGTAFGEDVAISSDGNTVATGACNNDDFANNAGKIFVYEWNGSAWVAKGSGIPGETGSNHFGDALDLSADGNTVVGGAPGNDGTGYNAGHARVFHWDGTTWIQHGADMDGEAANDASGFSVGLNAAGDAVAVGAHFNDGTGSDNGHCRVWDAPCVATGSTDTIVACDSITWLDGIPYAANNTIATHTLVNAGGCDSIITLHLTIANSFTVDTISACVAYTWIDGVNYTASNNTALDTLTNAAGCDSVVALNLTIHQSSVATISDSACASYSSPSGNHTWTTTGMYLDTLVNAIGCDSVITVDLTVFGAKFDTISANACYSYPAPSGSGSWTATGTYTDTLVNAHGCDSFLTVNLVLDTSSATLMVDACYSYNSPSGNYTWTQSGTYLDTLTTNAGCDSLIAVQLQINSSAQTIAPQACGSYTAPSGLQTWNTSGTYVDTLTNALGCDSILTINLTVNHSASDTISAHGCVNYTAPSGSTTWTTSGMYFDTLQTQSGCDSTLVIDLTISAHTSASITVEECFSFTAPSGLAVYLASGLYYDTIPNAAGCDSVIAIALTILGNPTVTQTIAACDSFVVLGNTYTASGTYVDTAQSALGCDSIITTILSLEFNSTVWDTAWVCAGDTFLFADGTLEPNASGTQTHTSMLSTGLGCDSVIHTTLIAGAAHNIAQADTLCGGDSYTYPDGTTVSNLDTTDVHVSNLQSVTGCDSIITTTIEVVLIDPVVSRQSDSLVVDVPDTADNSFQWLLCAPFTLLPGANDPYYLPQADGLYAVSVALDGCTDTSDCYTVSHVGIDGPATATNAYLFPNPAHTAVTVVVAAAQVPTSVQVFDIAGRLVHEVEQSADTRVELPVADLVKGIYLIKIRSGQYVQTLPLVLE